MAAILIDLDGTIADSRPGITACFRHMLRAMGHDPALAGDITWAVGPPNAVSVGRLLAIYGDNRVEQGVSTYRACYAAGGIADCSLFPGVRDLLIRLRDAGHALRVATSKRRDFAERVVWEILDLRAWLPVVYGALPGGGLDDKADLLAAILRGEGFRTGDTLMVGDRYHDIAAARANRLRSIGVLWGYGGREELREAGADHLAAAPGDVAALIPTLAAEQPVAPSRSTGH